MWGYVKALFLQYYIIDSDYCSLIAQHIWAGDSVSLCRWLLGLDAWREFLPLHSTSGSPEVWTWGCTAGNVRRTQAASLYSSWWWLRPRYLWVFLMFLCFGKALKRLFDAKVEYLCIIKRYRIKILSVPPFFHVMVKPSPYGINTNITKEKSLNDLAYYSHEFALFL